MSRHTKAPWQVKKKGKYYAVCSKNVPLALVFPNYIRDKSALRSNAILMATAPQLLNTLKEVYAYFDNSILVTSEGFKIDVTRLRESVVDAIRRAEGIRT